MRIAIPHWLAKVLNVEFVGLRRPVYAEAIFADGTRREIEGWIMEPGESMEAALHRTAIEMGAERAEIIMRAS